MLIIRWLLFALALLFVAWLVPGISLDSFKAALLASLVIGVVNLFIKPFLVVITIPITIITLGLFALVLNALLFLLVAKLVPGFTVDGFLSAFLGSIALSVLSVLINSIEY